MKIRLFVATCALVSTSLAMSPAAQQVAIAELDGWKRTTEDSQVWVKNNQFLRTEHLPDYVNDFNVIWKVIKSQPNHIRFEVNEALVERAEKESTIVIDYGAPIWAEVLLKSLTLWNDKK